MKEIEKGHFVQVGAAVGVVVYLENENNTPDGHLGIWYGELIDSQIPKYRTVPKEYCKLVTKVDSYH